MKRIFTFLLLAAVSVVAMAEKELYAVLDDTHKAMTVYYDENREARGGALEWHGGGNSPFDAVQEATLDESVKEARPTSTYGWFYKLYALATIKNFTYLNTTEVTDMGEMFMGCSSLIEIDLSNFNTCKVTNMNNLFAHCGALTELDLRGFDISKVEDTRYMFFDCPNLETIYCKENWSASATLTQSERMFEGCEKLKGGDQKNPTAYNAEKIDKEYARPDRASAGQPGYFTAEPGKELYGVLDGTTLNISYDQDYASKDAVFQWWEDEAVASTTTDVVFDASVADARPTNTTNWFYNFQNLTSITGLDKLNTSEVTTMDSMFYYCFSLGSLDLSSLNTSNVTNMCAMFYGCGVTELNLSGFNTSKVTDMSYMFAASELSSLDLSSFNTENVTNMRGMFEFCMYLSSLDISSFNTSKVTDMSQMFFYCTSLPALDLSKINTDNVTDMSYMFCGLPITSFDFSNINTDNVTNMSAMFNGCSKLQEIKLDGINTSNVTNMSGMFSGCKALIKLDLSGLNTGNVTDMSGMFNSCEALIELKLDGINTSNVTNMSSMFKNCTTLTELKLDGFNTDNVTDMSHMCNGCKALVKLDLSGVNTESLEQMYSMFNGCSSLTELKLGGLKTSQVTNMSNVFNNCSSLPSLDVSELNTSNVMNMSNMFSGCKALKEIDLTGFDFGKVTSTSSMFNGCSELETIRCSKDLSANSKLYSSSNMFKDCVKLKGGDATNPTAYDATKTNKEYARPDNPAAGKPGYFTRGADLYGVLDGSTLTIYYGLDCAAKGGVYEWWNTSSIRTATKEVIFDASVADAHPTSTANWFDNFQKLETISGLSNLNTSKVTDMSQMFRYCYGLKSLDLSTLNTGNVTNMSSMFYNCSYITDVNLHGFNTSKVTNMREMFYHCEFMKTLDVSTFNTCKVTDMRSMFSRCEALQALDLSGFNTENVTDMSSMFSSCKALTELDLRSFKTGKVRDMSYMFNSCTYLKTIICNDNWGESETLESSTEMFQSCTALVGGGLESQTKYSYRFVDADYARPDGWNGWRPGYFTGRLNIIFALKDNPELNYPINDVPYGTTVGSLIAIAKTILGGDSYEDDDYIYTFAGVEDTELESIITENRTYYVLYDKTPKHATYIVDTDASVPVQKLIQDGQLFLLRDGKTYTIHGLEVK